MDDIEYRAFKAVEALRKELVRSHRDILARCSSSGSLLQTLGEIYAIIGIPVDLTLHPEELIQFIWDTVAILNKRSTILISDGVTSKSMAEAVKDIQDDLMSDCVQELATGIIVTDDELAVPAAKLMTAEDLLMYPPELPEPPTEFTGIQLLPETKQKLH